MVELIPTRKGVGHQAMTQVVEGLHERGVDLPAKIVIEGPDDPWQIHAARVSVELRRRSVVAVATNESLLDAVRYDFGGATRLPVSSVSLEIACEAAATRPSTETPLAARGVVASVIEGADSVLGVGWPRARFWRSHVGSSYLIRRLDAVACKLECVPEIIPGPILVVGDRAPAEIRASIEDAETENSMGRVSPPTIVPLGRVLAALDISVEDEPDEADDPVDFAPRSVLELPGGRRVGSWSLTRRKKTSGSGWYAAPDAASTWKLEGPDGSVELVADFPAVSDFGVIKIPGWIGDHLCPGSPSGLLVEAVAEDPGRRGRPLWISNADVHAVRFLLGLPGPIWVDGPGVPVD